MNAQYNKNYPDVPEYIRISDMRKKAVYGKTYKPPKKKGRSLRIDGIEYVSIQEARKNTGISASTIRRMLKDGRAEEIR